MVCLVGSWVEFGFSVGMECFGLALVDQYSLESGVFWCSQVLDLSLLPLAFSLILTVASRLLYPYSTNDKTSRLMVKRFSTVRDTQKSLQRYMEKRRRRKEVEVTRREEGESKRERETNSLCAPQPGHPKRFTELGREEKRKRGDNSDLGEKWESQKGREQSSQ